MHLRRSTLIWAARLMNAMGMTPRSFDPQIAHASGAVKVQKN